MDRATRGSHPATSISTSPVQQQSAYLIRGSHLHITVERGQHQRRTSVFISHIDVAVCLYHLGHHLTKFSLAVEAMLANCVVEWAHTRPLVARVEVRAEADEPVDLCVVWYGVV